MDQEVLAYEYPTYGKWRVKYMLAHGGRRTGVLLWLDCACGVASYHGHVMCLLLSRQPRSRRWSRMLLTIKAHGPFGCLDPTQALRAENNRNYGCLYLSTVTW